jgi:hypothetical protein
MKRERQSEAIKVEQRGPQAAAQIMDLPPTDTPAEQAKGGLPAVQKVREAAARVVCI